MKMDIKALLFLSILVSTNGFACSCVYSGDFLKVAPQENLIFVGKVKKYLSFDEINKSAIPLAMEVEVQDTYKGTESRKTIVIWGDNGMLCRPYVTTFKIDQEYIFAVRPETFLKKNDDYQISICGEFWLNVDSKANSAHGTKGKEPTQIKLTDLKNKFKSS